MRFFPVPCARRVLFAVLCLVFSLGWNASLTITPNDSSPRRLLKARNEMEDHTGDNNKMKTDLTDSSATAFNNHFKGQKSRPSKPTGGQSSVIPKDPNSFFHPASLSHFKSSVASFKAWKTLHFFPDTSTLAHTKAQDAAAEIDHFIEEIASEHQSHRIEENSIIPH